MVKTRLRSDRRVQRVLLVGGFAALIALRFMWPERPLDARGVAAVWDHVFALAFTGYLLLTSMGLGGWLLRRTDIGQELGPLARVIHAAAIGLGTLAFAYMGLGVVGALTPLWIAMMTGTLLAATSDHLARLGQSIIEVLSRSKDAWTEIPVRGRTVVITAGAIGLASGLHAFTPAWSFDALMYHLEAPKLYLQAGRLILLPDIWQANGPMGIEMLYTAGLAFGGTSIARLLHLTFTAMLVLSTFAFARRFVGRRVAALAALVLVGIPILPIWGSIANIDSGWALYEALAVFAAVTWVVERKRDWLALSALLVGLALSTKYLAWAAFISVVAVLLLSQARGRFSEVWKPITAFSLTSVVIGSPWYILNLLRAGNPIYPFVFGGPGWDQARLTYLATYLSSFGHSDKLLSWVLAPVWLYLRNDLYSSFMSTIEFPSFLFPLALFVPLTLLDAPKWLKWLGIIALIRFFMWGMTSQQTRFLLPLYPAFSILTAYALAHLARSRVKAQTHRALVHGLIGGMLATTLVFQLVLWQDMRPAGVLVGSESKHGFLRRNSETYAGQAFIQSELPPGARVLMLYDGQGFYCDRRCVPDAEQSKWTQIVRQHDSVEDVADELERMNVTHLLVREDSLNFFLHHDPKGWHTSAIRFYLEEFRPACGDTVFQAEDVVIDELDCL